MRLLILLLILLVAGLWRSNPRWSRLGTPHRCVD